MKAASLNEIKQELSGLKPPELLALLLRLGRYKKENKELLTYLIFESGNEESYVQSVKDEISEQFKALNKSQLYLAKKTIRKVLRTVNKYIRYSGKKSTDADIRIFYCRSLIESGLPVKKSPVIYNIYMGQVKKIQLAIESMHEDQQADYNTELDYLKSY